MSDRAITNEQLAERVTSALRDVMDPEVGINVVDLGLVYGIDVDGGRVRVRLTMTTPACPMGDEIVRDAEHSIRVIEGVEDAEVELVWDPPWTVERMSPMAREMLGWGR